MKMEQYKHAEKSVYNFKTPIFRQNLALVFSDRSYFNSIFNSTIILKSSYFYILKIKVTAGVSQLGSSAKYI